MEKIIWKSEEFIAEYLSPHFRIMIKPDVERKRKDIGTMPLAGKMRKYVDEILELPIQYPAPPVFTVFAFPDEWYDAYIGRSFPNPNQPKKMCGLYVPEAAPFPIALAVNEQWLMNETNDPESLSQHIGLIHELAHTVHGAFFCNLPSIGEGFAEVLPQYIMAIKDPKQIEKITELPEEKIVSLKKLNEKGMFPKNNPEAEISTNCRTTYVSAYLWMRGYLREIEIMEKCDKISALNFVLKAFGAVSKISSKEEREEIIAMLIGRKKEQVIDGKELQIKAQNEIRENAKVEKMKTDAGNRKAFDR